MSDTVLIFDCANTLLRVDWDLPALAVSACVELGYQINEGSAYDSYRKLLRQRWTTYADLNRQKSEAVCDAFWRQLTQDWIAEIDLPDSALDPLIQAANAKLFGPESSVFSLFEDTLPTLIALRAAGYRMAVVSNWDVTLHKALRMFGLDPFFEVALASLEEGVEKPDPRLFEIALNRLSTNADQAVHIGDNPIDDLQGARNAGIRGILLDRQQATEPPWRISSLIHLQSVL